MANIILPQVNKVNEVTESANFLIEENGSIKRYAANSIINTMNEEINNLEEELQTNINTINADINTINTNLNTKLDKQNIVISTTDLVDGQSALNTGYLYFVYDEE